MHVVVVESPTKASTINRYLGRDYRVVASMGHVRDLPPKDGSVRPDESFAMDWAVTDGAEKNLRAIVNALRGAEVLYLATDPDREGEAISWHVLEELGRRNKLNGIPVKRVVFTEITKSAVLDAIAQPRDVDGDLVDAYKARRALDYLVGLHPFAGAVAQAARRTFGGPRAVRRAPAGVRPRSGDRSVRGPGILVRRGGSHDASRRASAGPARRSRRREARQVRPRRRGGGRSCGGAGLRGALPRRGDQEQAGQAKPRTALYHLHPPAGGRAQAGLRRPADHASRPTAL